MNRAVWLLLLGLVLILIGLWAYLQGWTQRYPTGDVDLLMPVGIGGMDQWIMANGESRDLPVLLWLHGGPGAAQMPVARYFNRDLEQEFIVVHWDQRGAGKSNPIGFDDSTMTVERYLQDVHEMTAFLKSSFGQDRIYLLGHSWGAQLGIAAASRHPEDYIAYIGVAQVVNHDDSQALAYAELARRIEAADKERDREHLATLGEPPYRDHAQYVAFVGLMNRYGMNMDVNMTKLARVALGSGVYGLGDLRRWLDGADRGSGPMWAESQGWDILEWAPQVDVPCFFITGEHDYNTPPPLVERLVSELVAPSKEQVVLAGAAHMPFLADPERFHAELRRIKSLTWDP